MRVIVAALVLLALAPAAASADCCMGGTSVWLPPNTPLAGVMHPIVGTDDLDHPEGVTVHTFLNVAGTRVADLGRVHVTATATASEFTLRIPAAVLRRARAAGDRAHTRRGVLKFVTTPDPTPAGASRTVGHDAYVTLRPGRPTGGRTALVLGRSGVTGSRERLRGTITVPTPRGWLRTSGPGDEWATFAPVPVDGACSATVLVRPAVFAVTTLASAMGHEDSDAALGVVASGARGGGRWVVRAGDGPRIAALGLVRVRAHRWAGARVDVQFRPGCPATAARTSSLLAPVQRIVSRFAADVRLGR